MDPRQLVYAALMWGTLIYAMRRGGWPERSAAWTMVIASILSATVGGDYNQIQARLVVYDAMAFAAFFAIALFSERYWTLWVAAMAALTLVGHLLPLMPLSNPWVYFRAVALWSWPMLLIIARAVYQRSLEAKANAVLQN